MKTDGVGERRIDSGRLFHSVGPAMAKARFPNLQFDRVTAKSPFDADRSPCLDWREVQGVTSDEMYEGDEFV